jgi:prepilin-type processing-associated H-X9-DG protein
MFYMEGNAQIQQTSSLPWAQKVTLGAAVIGASPTSTTAMNQTAVQPIFYCPSRRPAALYSLPTYNASSITSTTAPGINNAAPLDPNGGVAKTDYAGNGGSLGFNLFAKCNGVDCTSGGTGTTSGLLGNDVKTYFTVTTTTITDNAAQPPTATFAWYTPPCSAAVPGGPPAHCPSVAVTNTVQSASFTGIFWYRSQVSLRQISDGTSKVYMIGEKYLDQLTASVTNALDSNGNGDEGSVYHGMCPALIRLGANGGIYTPKAPPLAANGAAAAGNPTAQYLYPPRQDAPVWPGEMSGNSIVTGGYNPIPPGALQDWYGYFSFGSAHPGGFNMAFCDGSVHLLSYEIDSTVHAMLSDRQDGQSVDSSLYLH